MAAKFTPNSLQEMIHTQILPDLEALPGLIAAASPSAKVEGPSKADARKAIAASDDPAVIANREKIASVTQALNDLFTETAQMVLPDYSASATVDTEAKAEAKAKAKAAYDRIQKGIEFGETAGTGFREFIGDIPKPSGVHSSTPGDGPKRPRLSLATIDGETVTDATYTVIVGALKAKGIGTTVARLHALAREAAGVADISDVSSAKFTVEDDGKTAEVSVTHKPRD